MSSMLSLRSSTFQRSVVLAAGIAGVFSLGCAIYFDYKRRSDPDYKQKVRENRKAEQNSDVVDVQNKFPNPQDPEASGRFFMEQFALGKELMQNGDLDQAVAHFANAAFASGRPADVVQLCQQMFPEEQFSLLTKALPAAAIRHYDAVKRYAVVNARQEDETPGKEDSQIVVLDDYSVSKDVAIQVPKENVAKKGAPIVVLGGDVVPEDPEVITLDDLE